MVKTRPEKRGICVAGYSRDFNFLSEHPGFHLCQKILAENRSEDMMRADTWLLFYLVAEMSMFGCNISGTLREGLNDAETQEHTWEQGVGRGSWGGHDVGPVSHRIPQQPEPARRI